MRRASRLSEHDFSSGNINYKNIILRYSRIRGKDNVTGGIPLPLCCWYIIMNEINATPKKGTRINTKDLVIIAMFTAVICILSQISIQVQPIPFTLGLFAIFLTGAMLSPRNALLAVLVYLLLGTFGLPVFVGFKGGPGVLVGMTGGYLMAYPLMAFITALSYKLAKKYKVIVLVTGMVVSLLLCYLIGTAWFTYITDNTFYTALTLCVFPFVVFDVIKIVLAVSLSTVLRAVLKNTI